VNADTLRVFELHGSRPEPFLALEEDLLERAAAGEACLLLGSWSGPVVVLGYAQPEGDVDLAWCRARDVPVLRRISGGTGVVHDRDLAVALALPSTHPWARGLRSLYGLFLEALAPALRSLGAEVERTGEGAPAVAERSPICFEDQGSDTLVVGGRKVVGCAQARRARAVLVHAAVLLRLEAEVYARVFRVEPGRVARALAPAVADGDPAEVGRAVAEAFARDLGAEARWSPAPQPSARAMARFG